MIKKVKTRDGVITTTELLEKYTDQAFRKWVIQTFCRSKILVGFDEAGKEVEFLTTAKPDESETPAAETEQPADDRSQADDSVKMEKAKRIVRYYIDRGFSVERSIKEALLGTGLSSEQVQAAIGGEKSGGGPSEQ